MRGNHLAYAANQGIEATLCRLLVPIRGIEAWSVGLRWDDDEQKSRIVCLGCECGCLRQMKWWGIRVQWNSSLMGGDSVRYCAGGGVW